MHTGARMCAAHGLATHLDVRAGILRQAQDRSLRSARTPAPTKDHPVRRSRQNRMSPFSCGRCVRCVRTLLNQWVRPVARNRPMRSVRSDLASCGRGHWRLHDHAPPLACSRYQRGFDSEILRQLRHCVSVSLKSTGCRQFSVIPFASACVGEPSCVGLCSTRTNSTNILFLPHTRLRV